MVRGEDIDSPAIHYGQIASGNQLMKDAKKRDKLADEEDILCFEMEAAGLMNHFPCLVVRGICDYADSHNNQAWQGYAAMSAAAYAKQLLTTIAPRRLEAERKILDVISSVGIQVQAIASQVQQISLDVQESEHRQHSRKIQDWLRPPDPSTNHNQARKLHHSGTGFWFLNSEDYKQWKMKSTTALWLHGIPGCGKTILSSTIIQDLQLSPHMCLYFYFDFNDSQKKTLDSMLRSLIFQLYQQNDDSQRRVQNLMTYCGDGKEQPPTPVLAITLQAAIEAVGDVCLVIDALDECGTRRELLAWLDSPIVRQWHLLVTSREEHDMKVSLMRWMGIFPIRTAPVDGDIRTFVRSSLTNDQDFTRWKKQPEAHRMIENRLMEKSGGMFRLVVCQIESLRDCLDWLSLEQTLGSLPETLEKVYDQILLNIPTKHRASAVRLLQFLSYSSRPLLLEEAIDVIAVRLDDIPTFRPRYRMPESLDLARYCASLTRVVSRNGHGRDREIVTEIQLAHLSVQEYLVSGRVEETFQDEFRESRARGCIVQVSLAYLCQVLPLRGRDSTRLPFLDFAVRYWLTHARLAEEEGKAVLEWIHKLFTSEELYRSWLEIYRPPGFASNRDPLYYASLGGMKTIVQALLEESANVNASGGDCSNALCAASQGGHQEVVKLLLEKGADFSVNGLRRSALEAASAGGHKEVVELLIGAGADIDAQEGNDGNPLQVAARNGDQDMAKLLLDLGANIDARGIAIRGNEFSAFCVAVENGHLETVRLLLDKGARVDLQGALRAASAKGHQEVVQLLLDKGADVNSIGALHAASSSGHREVVRLLLDRGADAEPEDVLFGASEEGQLGVVQLLLDRGVDANSEGALWAASVHGHEEVVRLLLDRGADVNSQDALWAASMGGHLGTVELLLDTGADVNAYGRDQFDGGSGDLRPASAQDHREAMRLLWDKGTEANFRSALYVALKRDHQEVTQLLLDRGADVDPRAVFHALLEGGSLDIAKLFLRTVAQSLSIRLPQYGYSEF